MNNDHKTLDELKASHDQLRQLLKKHIVLPDNIGIVQAVEKLFNAFYSNMAFMQSVIAHRDNRILELENEVERLKTDQADSNWPTTHRAMQH